MLDRREREREAALPHERVALHARVPVQGVHMSVGLKNGSGTLKQNVTWEKPVWFCNGVEAENLHVGAYTYVAEHSWLRNATIGRYCSISGEVRIVGGNHPTEWVTQHPFPWQNLYPEFVTTTNHLPFNAYPAQTEIGHDVWIGWGATVLYGVKIGTGAVLGAGSVITKDVPPYAVVAGNPAKVIRFRFEPEQVAELLKSHWWDYDFPATGNMSRCAFDNPQAFLRWFKENKNNLPRISSTRFGTHPTPDGMRIAEVPDASPPHICAEICKGKEKASPAPNELRANLHALHRAGMWPALLDLAERVATQWPACSFTLRQLGIARIMTGKEYIPPLARAATLGDKDAPLWQAAAQAFQHYPTGTFKPEDICQHVAYLAMQNSPYMNYPTEVTIETQAICNARCTFCPYATMHRKGERMADSLIEKTLNELTQIPQNLPFTISPFKLSDPFLDKRIFSICETINNTLPQAKLRLFSNGTPLNAKMLDKIARIQRVEHLWISLNEYEPEAYHEAMRLPFALTIKNLDHLHALVQQGYPHPVHISRVGDCSPRDKAFAEFVRNRYPRFAVSVLTRGTWSGQVGSEIEYRVPPTPCMRWFELSIMASGKVALCCQDGVGEHVIGDVNANTVLEVYNSPQYKQMRQFSTSRLATRSPCNTCYI